MEQQDYLKRQIDQLGRVLGRILAEFLGLKNKGQINEGLEITYQNLKCELDIDVLELVEIPNDEFIQVLKLKKNLTDENLSELADILMLIAETSNELNHKLYEKCLIAYQYLEKSFHVYSMDRHWKIERIQKLLQ